MTREWRWQAELPDDYMSGTRFVLGDRTGRKSLTIGPRKTRGRWHERDNFPTLEGAVGYAALYHKWYPWTPYRIVPKGQRYVVQFVPSLEFELA
jgi:hypothetical protein